MTELTQIDALPGAQVQPTVRDRDGQTHAEKRTFGMGRHVVGAFQHVVIVGFSLPDQMVQDFLHVASHVGIGIFIDGESA